MVMKLSRIQRDALVALHLGKAVLCHEDTLWMLAERGLTSYEGDGEFRLTDEGERVAENEARIADALRRVKNARAKDAYRVRTGMGLRRTSYGWE